MKLRDTDIRRNDRRPKVVSHPGTESEGLLVGPTRGLEVAESLVTCSVRGVPERQTSWVPARTPGPDCGFQATCCRREFKEKEITVRFRIGQHRRNVGCELRYRDLRLLSGSSHPALVPGIGTRSGAFKQRVPD